MKDIYNELIDKGILSENIFLDEPMNKHTSFKIGGTADYFINIYAIEELKSILEIANNNNIPIFILGNGTNILVKDEGYRGIILRLKLEDIKFNGTEVIVGSGVKNAILQNKLKDNELEGFEFASGIPGTIGGAIKMNAGAYGKEYKDIVEEVTYMDYKGNIYAISNKKCEFSYRHSRFSNTNDIIIQAKLKFEKGNIKEIEDKIKELDIKRKEKQPFEYPNAGSTFKRGKNYITAQLIDECGLKGYKIGGAEVSTKHAGFIINKNNATSKDVLELIEHVKMKVKEKTGFNIDTEIEIIGG